MSHHGTIQIGHSERIRYADLDGDIRRVLAAADEEDLSYYYPSDGMLDFHTTQSLQRAIAKYRLDSYQLVKLFRYLGWMFTCNQCHGVRSAYEFDYISTHSMARPDRNPSNKDGAVVRSVAGPCSFCRPSNNNRQRSTSSYRYR
ncbi:hypothetical protein VFPPC_17518 [Pochonia chlamydosporia 170]|uniref:Uncharacterized protein n=1 Tax=Pochonia chlamydosporia 170 TaxID=1380566 RepID=A0A219ARV1_METCM|nr:hypothetical protein VFPPC_17518 [Pochonia chlamydosporia 170]OWT43319.1 hypothetical protein VFPPC_17518 [Pochonia chlamydosporia 170]